MAKEQKVKKVPTRDSVNERIQEAFNEIRTALFDCVKSGGGLTESEKLAQVENLGKKCVRVGSLIQYRDETWNPDGTLIVKPEAPAAV